MFKRVRVFTAVLIALLTLVGCSELDEWLNGTQAENEAVTDATNIEDLIETDHFRPNALAHILEGELNRKGQAVGFHYDHLPSKKGEIIDGTKSTLDDNDIFEAEVKVDGVDKTSNKGKSTFFPDHWDSQDVVDAINEAYESKDFVNGNTYEGLTEEGIIIQMYLDDSEKIISAFPVYEGS